MVWQRIRIALFVCTVLAVSASTVLAQDEQKDDKAPEKIEAPKEKEKGPAVPAATGDGCGGGGTRTVYVTECVPEYYTAKRTVYKSECRTENYTYYKCETVPECRERTVCVTKRVPCMETVTRKVCCKIPVCEERTVMKPCYSYQNVTTTQCRTVDRGHWECREVYSHTKAFQNWFGGLGHGHKHGCNDDCNACQQQTCSQPCNTRTKKVWVSCRVTEQCPVTVCKKVCTMVPTTCKVNTYRTEWKEQTSQVCTYKCVTESRVEKYTVCVQRKVPCQGTRQVRVCVPCEETYQACRMVSRCVPRQVADTTCCSSPSTDCCNTNQGWFGGRMHGLFNRGGHGHQRTSSCGSGCCN